MNYINVRRTLSCFRDDSFSFSHGKLLIEQRIFNTIYWIIYAAQKSEYLVFAGYMNLMSYLRYHFGHTDDNYENDFFFR